jgi:hypothetical protein
MENIGDKDAAIAERVRALLAAANSSSATASAALPPSVGAVPVPPPAAVPAGVRRLESSTDPATVVANLTVAGIRYAVSYFDHFSAGWLYHRRWIRSPLWIRTVPPRYLFWQILSMFIMSSHGPENFLLYITARIRTFLKPGIVRVRKTLYGSGRGDMLHQTILWRADPGVRIRTSNSLKNSSPW